MAVKLDMPNQESASRDSTALEFGHVTPILRVSNIEASLDYYVRALGFALEWRDGQFGSVRRGKASLMLCEGDQGNGTTWVWLGVGDVDAVHDELRTRGAAIRHPPTNYPWGSRELQVLDPDGHVLRLGSDLLPHEPNGEWLDGGGIRWIPQPRGGWRRAEWNTSTEANCQIGSSGLMWRVMGHNPSEGIVVDPEGVIARG